MKQLLCIISLILGTTFMAKNSNGDNIDHLTHGNNINSHHHHHSNEKPKIMAGLNLGYGFIESKNDHMNDDSGVMIGFHLMKEIKDALSGALGIHKIFTDDEHIGLMLGLMYSPNENFIISLMPGVMYMKHSQAHNMGMGQMGMQMPSEKEWASEYGTHLELSYKSNIFNKDLNASVGLMESKSHSMYFIGLNFHL